MYQRLWTAGERRKFARNMQFNTTARQVGFVGFAFVRLLAPVLLVIGLTAVAYAMNDMTAAHAHGAAAGHIGAPVAAAAALPTIRALREKNVKLGTEAQAILAKAGDGQLSTTERVRINQIKRELNENNEAIDTALAFGDERPAGSGARTHDRASDRPWASLGDFLHAVFDHDRSQGRVRDPRLMAAAQGANESVPAEGGFLVVPEFAQDLIKRAYDTSLLANLCFNMEMKSSRLVMHAVDEDSRVDGSRWGGVQAYWISEAGNYTPTKPKFREMQLVANKLTGLVYLTEEVMEDAPALQAFIQEAFPQEFGFQFDAAILAGSGAGQPLGIQGSGAVVTVAKDGGQTAKTITTTNVLNMWSRLWAKSRKNAVWLINQDVEPQLYPLTLGSGTAVVLLYTPPGVNGNPGPYGKLMGRDVIPIEQASTLGTQGDIMLVDLSQYILAKKAGGVRADMSIHVAFLTGENAFRFQVRADGQPLWKKPLTPYKGANTLSPFIQLQSR